MSKRILSIFSDDYTLKAALVIKDGKETTVEMLQTFQLVDPMVNEEIIQEQGEETRPASAAFGTDLDQNLDSKDESVENEKTNIDIILDLLEKMYTPGTQVVLNLSDSHTLYKTLDVGKEKSDKKIKNLIWSSLNENEHSKPILDNVAYIKHPSGILLGLVHDDPFMLADLFFEAAKMISQRPIQLKSIDPVEFALASHINKNLDLEQDETTVVLNFTQAFTKIFFMKGKYVETVLPTIHEGSDTENICETVFSKILFEMNSSQKNIHRIVVTGDINRLDTESFFEERMEGVSIWRLDFPDINMGMGIHQEGNQLTAYSVPVALALKWLEPEKPAIYVNNFLPRRIKDKVSIYKISWHGFIFLAVLFISVMMLTFEMIKKNESINETKVKSKQLDLQLEELELVAVKVDSLNNLISTLQYNTALIDSMSKYTTRWTPIMKTFSDAYTEIGPFAMLRMETKQESNKKLRAELIMNDKEQVARLERFIEQSLISTVNTTEEHDDYYRVSIEIKINQ